MAQPTTVKVIAEWRRGGTSCKSVALVRDYDRNEPNNYSVIINDERIEAWQDKLYLTGGINLFNAAVKMMEKAED